MALAVASQVHPDLRLEKLARLPPDLRRIAKIAASGSLESLTRLERPVKEGPENRALLLLPVFYANLDLESIPSPDEVDTTDPSPDVASTLMRAYVSLQALDSYPNLSPELLPILWPRVWAWIDFLDTYHYHLGNASSEHANRVHYLQKIRWFRSHENATELVDSTHGVWTMVARMWTLCVERDGFARGSAGTTAVGYFIAGPISAVHLDELLEALGGTQRDLAAVVVRHITLVTRDPRNPLAASNLYHLHSVTVFLAQANRLGYLVREAFAYSGLTRALVESACALTQIKGVEAADLLRLTWNLLRWVVTENVLHVWMPLALKSGLLRAIVACATHSAAATDIPDFRQVLTRDLPPSLVYSRVLSRMVKAIRDPEVRTADLHGSAIFDEWKAFLDLAKARLAVYRFFTSDEYISSRACDNMKCAAIDQRKRFSMCSVCRRRCYCSADCQRIDWTEGGHKTACEILYIDRTDHPEDLRSRDIYFLRALLHHDYHAARHDIRLQQIAFMHEHPGTDFYTHFDYSRGAVSVKVLPQSNSNHPRDLGHPLRIAQAAASGGCLELHYMFVSAGSTARGRWFPLRSSSGVLAQRLAVIARGIEFDAQISAIRERLLEDIRALDEEVAEVVQIH
ncbi:hypothetical protein B0H19DRAFT_1233920 [Mycena capillaripes]|nr:hypothetical protein B0H19DRAFT_1233920 [Mycena capillaripes]